MGAGLRDAHNLAWKLAGVLSGDLPPIALDSYEEERKPHARSMIRLALAVGRFMTAGGEAGNLLRRVVVPRIGLIPGVRHRIVDSSTPALHRSFLVQRRRGPRSLIGTLCPNPALPDGRRLDDILGNSFALVTTQPLTVAQHALAEGRGAAVHFVAAGSELARWLHRGHTKAAIVRPDRTVMATARRPGHLLTAVPDFRRTVRAIGNLGLYDEVTAHMHLGVAHRRTARLHHAVALALVVRRLVFAAASSVASRVTIGGSHVRQRFSRKR